MTSEQILKIFETTGALLNGHFLLSSGLHSPQYFQCAKVLQYPHYAEQLCSIIGNHFIDKNVQVVIAPAIGGILVSYEVARQLSVRSIFAERENGTMILKRGFELGAGEKVLIVEDVITTGGSVKEVIDLVKNLSAEIVGIGCLVDRSGGKINLEFPIFSLIQLEIEAVSPQNCPLCKQKIPIVKPGSRKF